MTREQELGCFRIAGDLFDTAKELSSKYNAILIATKECENIHGIPYEEFKTWLDNTLAKLNEGWNKQFDALVEGKSQEEVRSIALDTAKDTLKELFDD